MNTASDRYVKAKMERGAIVDTIMLGFAIGIFAGVGYLFLMREILSLSLPASVVLVLCFGIALSGMPYMWTRLPKVYGLGPMSLILMAIKLVVAGFCGFIITPLALIFRCVQVGVYRKEVVMDKQNHPEDYIL